MMVENNKNTTIKLPHAVSKIIVQLNKQDFQAAAVGGCVRDSLLGKIPHDYDICTAAKPEEMKRIFKENKENTYDTGIKHGTISVMVDGELYEVTTYREDGEYSDGRHPDEVIFVDDIAQDLARRDFTINAMAFNENDGLVDPFNGREDLANKTIRCVGDPNARFQEDALRVLRAIRFASTYGFTIEPATKQAIFDNKQLLTNIAQERKTSEFVKILKTADAQLLRDYRDVFAEFIPEIKDMFECEQKVPFGAYDVWEHTVRTVESLPNDEVVRLAAFFHDIAKPHEQGYRLAGAEMTEEIMRRMKFDNQTIKDVSNIIRYQGLLADRKSTMKCIIRDIGVENTRKLILVANANDLNQSKWSDHSINNDVENYNKLIDEVLANKECYLLKDLAVNGNDLIEIGIPKGKTVGAVLNTLFKEVIIDPDLNERETLLNRACEIYCMKRKEKEEEIEIER